MTKFRESGNDKKTIRIEKDEERIEKKTTPTTEGRTELFPELRDKKYKNLMNSYWLVE